MNAIQIILLDENAFFLNTLDLYLRKMNFTIHITISQYVFSVLTKIRDDIPDLLIFNLNLHAMNPLQFCKQVKKQSPKIKMIAYANVNTGFCAKAIYPDIDECLAQDELFETLYPTICRLFHEPDR